MLEYQYVLLPHPHQTWGIVRGIVKASNPPMQLKRLPQMPNLPNLPNLLRTYGKISPKLKKSTNPSNPE